MPFVLIAKIDYCYVAPGTDGSLLGQRQSNFPGYTQMPMTAGVVPSAQSCSDFIGEPIPGGDTATDAQFQAALNQMAADLYQQAITPGAVMGFTAGKLTDLIRGWPSGNP